MLNDEQLIRYSRHILLNEWDIATQEKLLISHALIIGIGGLGSAAAIYLTTSGVGKLTLIDNDLVDLSNLQRQIIHTTESVGQMKTESAKLTLSKLNPSIVINTINSYANSSLLNEIIPKVNIVLDCSDNFKTKYLINEICLKNKVPLVSGAALGFNGQILSFDTRRSISPCYACVFPVNTEFNRKINCVTMGIFSPVVGIIGSMQAADTLKILGNINHTMIGRILSYNAITGNWKKVIVTRDKSCFVCAKH